MTRTADVVVVGAGIVGACSAWRLAQRGLDVVVLEKEDAPALGSTGRSAAGVRVQFTTAANIGLSMYSLPFYRTFREVHGREIGYNPIGYLLLVPPARWERHLQAVALQRALGAPVDVVEVADALDFVPFAPEGLAGATYGPWDGVLDPHMATLALVDMGRTLGVDFQLGASVRSASYLGSTWHVETTRGTYEAPRVVNAAGAWSGHVAELAGLDLPIGPKRIQIFLSAPVVDERTFPLTIDVGTGVYLRTEGDRVLFGLDDLEQPFGFTEGIEDTWLEHVLVTGVERFPWWSELGVDRKRSWWGYYAVSPDNSPVIGEHPASEGWIDACGFSGHGISHAPATGLAVSELVADGHSHTLDVSAFRHDRFGRDVAVEANIF